MAFTTGGGYTGSVTTLRLLADDLTGALDSAARFVPLVGPVYVTWHLRERLPPTAALDTGTRDLHAASVCAAVRTLAPVLSGADIAFKKIDSLLRGHIAAELAICMRYFDRCVLAPAFPFQGRITRGGRQLVHDGNRWRDAGVDLPAALRAEGLSGVQMLDAETDADLESIVTDGRVVPGRVLWCGTGGLAGALAGNQPVFYAALKRPILALIGSDHDVSARQLAAMGDCLHRLQGVTVGTADAIRRTLLGGAAAVCVALPAGTPRAEASQRINACFMTVLEAFGDVGTVVISGGETLRRLCDGLGAVALEVDGEIVPGVPTAIMLGGSRNGQRIVSKSGAFGDDGFLARLLTMPPGA